MLIVLVTGDGGKDSPGQLVINSTSKSKTDFVEKIGKRYIKGSIFLWQHMQIVMFRICELLGGKGGGKGQRYNAKLSNMKNISIAEEYVKSLFIE